MLPAQIILYFEKLRVSHQLVYRAHAQPCHILPELLGDKAHEVHHILRFTLEVFAQLRVLGGHAYGTGVQIAHPHHHAAHSYQRRRGKAEFLRPQNCRNGHIPSAHQLSVRLNPHLVSESVHNQRLMGLRKPQFPGKSGVVNGASGRRARSSVIA